MFELVSHYIYIYIYSVIKIFYLYYVGFTLNIPAILSCFGITLSSKPYSIFSCLLHWYNLGFQMKNSSVFCVVIGDYSPLSFLWSRKDLWTFSVSISKEWDIMGVIVILITKFIPLTSKFLPSVWYKLINQSFFLSIVNARKWFSTTLECTSRKCWCVSSICLKCCKEKLAFFHDRFMVDWAASEFFNVTIFIWVHKEIEGCNACDV